MSHTTSQLASDSDSNGTGRQRRRVVAFEIETEGHHPSYIRNFATQWAHHSLPADLDFVVTPLFFERHGDVVEAVSQVAPDAIRIHSLTTAEHRWLQSRDFRC